MEPSVFLSPLVLTITGIIAAFTAVLLALDVRRSQDHKRLQGVINRYVANKVRKNFDVIIELDRSADAIIPLLDRLARTDYDKLRVLVVVRHTAGKRAVSELRRYQQLNKANLKMSVIKHKKGMDRQFILKRYAKNELVMWLERDERLSMGFFRRVSLEFLDTSVNAIAPRQVAALNDTLASASQGLNVVVRDIFASLKGKSDEPKVYRRTAMLKDDITSIRYVSHSAITMPAIQTHRSYDGIVALVLLLVLLAIGISSYLVIPRSWILIISTAIGAALVSLTLHLSSFNYQAINKLILFLFLPFWVVLSPFTPLSRKVAKRRRLATSAAKTRAFTLW